ncbi:MAG: hypothetical protein ACRETH_00660 [Steroidobacteraceae bacterium]
MLPLARRREGVFKLVSGYRPEGDQPPAIDALARNVTDGVKQQVLLGVTGSGKTFVSAVRFSPCPPSLSVIHQRSRRHDAVDRRLELNYDSTSGDMAPRCQGRSFKHDDETRA